MNVFETIEKSSTNQIILGFDFNKFFSGSKMGLVERKHHNVNQETRTGKRFNKYLFSPTCLNYLHRFTLKSKTI